MSDFQPELADVLKAAVLDVSGEWHTSTPGQIVSYNAAKQTVVVQPTLKRTYTDDDGNEVVTQMPQLQDVPVVFPKGGGFSFTYPVAAGDYCLLLFTERSIEIWKRDGGIVDPADTRRQHLSDAVALVGLSPSVAPIAGVDATKVQVTAPGDIVLKGAAATVTVAKTGDVTISNGAGTIKLSSAGKFTLSGVQDLMQNLIDLANALTTAQVMTALGPQTILPPEATTFATIKSNLTALKG